MRAGDRRLRYEEARATHAESEYAMSDVVDRYDACEACRSMAGVMGGESLRRTRRARGEGVGCAERKERGAGAGGGRRPAQSSSKTEKVGRARDC